MSPYPRRHNRCRHYEYTICNWIQKPHYRYRELVTLSHTSLLTAGHISNILFIIFRRLFRRYFPIWSWLQHFVDQSESYTYQKTTFPCKWNWLALNNSILIETLWHMSIYRILQKSLLVDYLLSLSGNASREKTMINRSAGGIENEDGKSSSNSG